MGFVTVFILALGLCFDSFAVSVSGGMAKCGVKKRQLFGFAAVMGLFQGIMPFLGWSVASRLHTYIEKFDHWIAFVLLVLIGAKMIVESFSESEEPECRPFRFSKICLLGFATSIDALVAGGAMAMVQIRLLPGLPPFANMLLAAIIIAVVTFIASTAGLVVGRSATGKLSEKAELIGGIILVAIGFKVLLEHLLQ